MTAALGPYTGPPRVALNASRVTSALNCEQRAAYEYEDDRVPARNAPALDIGTLWHTCRERLSEGTPLADVIEEAEAACDDLIEQYALAGWNAADLRGFRRSVRPMLELWAEQHPNPPRIIAVEQPFHMLFGGVLILGTFDSVFEDEDGFIWTGEIKTTGSDPATLMSWRANHPQQILYERAARQIYGARFAGTRYELLCKNWFPAKASGGLTLDERIERWPATVHHIRTIWWEKRDYTYWRRVVRRFAGTRWRTKPLRNPMACMTFGRPQCPYFDVCHRGYPLAGIDYEDRAADYVDHATHPEEAKHD